VQVVRFSGQYARHGKGIGGIGNKRDGRNIKDAKRSEAIGAVSFNKNATQGGGDA
jgi:hypothetical protein